MKKALVYTLGLIAVFAGSCRRDYSCTCVTNTLNTKEEHIYYIGKTTESDALKQCKDSYPSHNDSCFVYKTKGK